MNVEHCPEPCERHGNVVAAFRRQQGLPAGSEIGILTGSEKGFICRGSADEGTGVEISVCPGSLCSQPAVGKICAERQWAAGTPILVVLPNGLTCQCACP
jgi:hypothetical protein